MKLVWHWFVSSGNMFLDIINESLRLIVSNFILCSSRKRIYFVATVMIEEYEDSAVEAFLPKDRVISFVAQAWENENKLIVGR